MSVPLSLMAPLDGSTSRSTLRATVDLPQPDSPTSPSVSPLPTREADAVDGMHGADAPAQDAAAHRVMLDEVGDLEQGALIGHGAPTNSAARQHAAK